jgi:NTE family protein
MKQSKRNYKVGICLSGGGALGYAHIGVLQALIEHDIEPEIISGSSMGAIIGVLYAQDIKPNEMLSIIENEKINKLSRIFHPVFSEGISSLKTLREMLEKHIPHNSFELLKHEFHVCVSNLTNATWKTISSGNNLHDYVIASASVPFIFESITINENIYVDGSLFNNMPTQPLKGKCDIIIGVDVVPYFEVKEVKNANEVLSLSIRSIEHRNGAKGRKHCDFLIESPAIETYSAFSFDKYKEIYQIGYESASKYINEHPEIHICKNCQ